MPTKNTPKRKHLTVIEKGEKTYFRVQINKTKLGLKVNKTFTDYEQAVMFLDACENKLGSKHVKTMIDIESKEYKLIGEFLKRPPLTMYVKEYIETYINPKYQHLNPAVEKDRYDVPPVSVALGFGVRS